MFLSALFYPSNKAELYVFEFFLRYIKKDAFHEILRSLLPVHTHWASGLILSYPETPLKCWQTQKTKREKRELENGKKNKVVSNLVKSCHISVHAHHHIIAGKEALYKSQAPTHVCMNKQQTKEKSQNWKIHDIEKRKTRMGWWKRLFKFKLKLLGSFVLQLVPFSYSLFGLHHYNLQNISAKNLQVNEP